VGFAQTLHHRQSDDAHQNGERDENPRFHGWRGARQERFSACDLSHELAPAHLVVFAAFIAVALKYSGSHSTQGVVSMIANTPPLKVAAAVTAVKAANAPPVPAPVADMQNVVAAAAANTATPAPPKPA
jgi:hypothetical protein